MFCCQDNFYVLYDWVLYEKLVLFGLLLMLLYSLVKCFVYGVVGLLVCFIGVLGNVVVIVNLQLLQGIFVVWLIEIVWLLVVYVMINVFINLLLVKFCQQFGLCVFIEGFLVFYVLVIFFYFFVNDFSLVMMVCVVYGMVVVVFSLLGIYYQVQVWFVWYCLKGLIIGIIGLLLVIFLVCFFFIELLQIDEWCGFYFFELGLVLVLLVCVIVLKLLLSDCKKVFEKKDFIIFFLLVFGMVLVCVVLLLGWFEWWFEVLWIGWVLVVVVILIVVVIIFEYNCSNFLFNIKWFFSGSIVCLGLIMLLICIVLVEQNIGVIGWLQYVGL